MKKLVFIFMVNPVVLGLVCALLDYFLHINYKFLLTGAFVCVMVGLVGLVVCSYGESGADSRS